MTLQDKLKELEGKYFLFEFSADYTVKESHNGHALEIFQVRNGKLEEVWHPCDHAFMNGIDEEQSVKACEYLKQNRIEEVYTPGWVINPGSFLDIQFDDYTDRDNWVQYEPLTRELHYWKSFLQRFDITLKIYDEEKPPKDIKELLDRILKKTSTSPNPPKSAL